MIEVEAVTDLNELDTFKAEYLSRTTAPLDGMWLCGFVPIASHFSFRKHSTLIGYCCINDEGFLLQFYLRDSDIEEEAILLTNMLAGRYVQLPKIEGAYVSTAEPDYLSHCLDHFASFRVHTMMYQYDGCMQKSINGERGWSLETIPPEKQTEAIRFVLDNVDVPEEWLVQYLANLIRREELFGCWLDDGLVATGENRKFDEVQLGYTDLGVIVDQDQRERGLATWVLQQLAGQSIAMELKPLCSTDRAAARPG